MGGSDREGWRQAAAAGSDGVYVYRWDRDWVLKRPLYHAANIGLIKPVGAYGVQGRIKGIKNVDVGSNRR